ncbi:MAG: GHMP kinase [Chloroflexi bacterium]|nr:GHMP kinase [Chloroflexota bacterium]
MTLLKKTRRLPGSLVGSAAATAPGACGELVQGCLDGTHFLVTCPVNLYSRVSVVLKRCQSSVISGPGDCQKSLAAVKATLVHLGKEELSAELTVESVLPRGKGMASSTADVSAAIAATAAALGVALPGEAIARLAVSIEPSDGVMLPGISLFDHRRGSFHVELGPPPPIEIVALDFGGVVDTLEFNCIDRSAALRAMRSEISEALELVRRGVALGDPALVGKGATLSALLNQEILFKPHLNQVLDFAAAVGAVGVNAAHSGTVVGVLLDKRSGKGAFALERARKTFPDAEASLLLDLVGGGMRIGSGAPAGHESPS